MKQYTIKKIEILQKIKFFYSKYENNKSTLLSSLNFYLAPTAEYYGLLKILKFSKELKTFSLYVKIIKNILGGILFSNPKIIKKNKIINYSNVIITWANKSNFNLDGSIHDRYFNISSKKTKKTLWIVIYLDKHLPIYIKKNLNKNIIIYKNDFKNYNFLDFIKFLYKKLILFKNFELLIHNISNYAFFSEKFYEKTSKYFLKNLEYLYFPYESQPFQNKIIYNLNKVGFYISFFDFFGKEIGKIKQIINNSKILKKIIKQDEIKILLEKKQIQHSESKFLFSLLNIAMIENLNKN